MQVYWLVSLGCFVGTIFAINAKDTSISGENGWYVPLEDGSLRWIDMEEAEDAESYLEVMKGMDSTNNSVKFILYTRAYPDRGEIITASVKSIESSNFNPAHSTRFVIHGFTQNSRSYINRQIRNAWFSLGDYNFIFVEWSRAQTPNYFSAFRAVPGVGKKVAGIIDFLVKHNKISLHKLFVIGHSLGAHIAGHAGKNVKTGQIQSIIALDPAWPLFRYDRPDQRLNNNDAFYVESIQTNCGCLGFELPIGKASFYCNGGKSQPGCNSGFCDHGRSVLYYAEAVAKNNFGTISCKSYANAVASDCGDQFSSVRMGDGNNAYVANGPYYVPVDKEAPFGKLRLD